MPITYFPLNVDVSQVVGKPVRRALLEVRTNLPDGTVLAYGESGQIAVPGGVYNLASGIGSLTLPTKTGLTNVGDYQYVITGEYSLDGVRPVKMDPIYIDAPTSTDAVNLASFIGVTSAPATFMGQAIAQIQAAGIAAAEPAVAAKNAAQAAAASATAIALGDADALVAAAVPPLVAEALAADGTVADAAAAAVDGAVDGLDLVRATDVGIPRAAVPVDDLDDIVTDSVGRIASGYRRTDGAFRPSRLAPRVILIDGARIEEAPMPGYLDATVDATGRMAEDALTIDGRVPGWVLRNWSRRIHSALLGWDFYGDSMTQGVGSTTATIVNTFATATGFPARNCGASGQTSTEVALRSDALDVWLTVTGNQIPASGPVTVTSIAPTGTWRAGNVRTYKGTLAGVPGTLTKSATEVWTFTRTAAGSAVTCPPEGRWRSSEHSSPLVGRVIWVGRNNVDAAVVRDVRAMTKKAQADGVPYLVLPIFNMTTEPSGSAGYNNLVAINNALAEEHGPHFYDMRGYFIRHALADAGVTPTAADTTAISEDRIPPSLMSDTIHLTAAGYTVIGNRLAAITTAKGLH